MSTTTPQRDAAADTEPMLAAGEAARYSREREAHNKYFSEGTRKTLDKYYNTTHQSRASYESVLLSQCRNGAALEYGCGTGSHSVFLARNGATRVVGIDLSAAQLKAHAAVGAGALRGYEPEVPDRVAHERVAVLDEGDGAAQAE